MTLSPVKRMTVEEFEQYAMQPENQGRKLQLIHGEIVEEMPKLAHARISVRLIAWLLEYLKLNPVGEVLNELRIDLENEADHAAVPDICVVTTNRERISLLDDNDPLPFMPDLLIEIQSEGQSDRHMRDLADYCLTRGGRMVWLVYPDRKLVEWLTPTDRQLLTIDGTLVGGDVLPDFTLPVSALFA